MNRLNLKVFIYSQDDAHVLSHAYNGLPFDAPIPNVGDIVPVDDDVLRAEGCFSGEVAERYFSYCQSSDLFEEEQFWELLVELVVVPMPYGGE